jgi:hypothetical protein
MKPVPFNANQRRLGKYWAYGQSKTVTWQKSPSIRKKSPSVALEYAVAIQPTRSWFQERRHMHRSNPSKNGILGSQWTLGRLNLPF